MKPLYRNLLIVLSLNFPLFFLALFLLPKNQTDFNPGNVLFLSVIFTLITSVSLVIFFRGLTREPDTHTMHTIVSISLKFLLEMILALIWFIVVKKSSFESVLIFFVLYLTFTMTLVLMMLNPLKTRSL